MGCPSSHYLGMVRSKIEDLDVASDADDSSSFEPKSSSNLPLGTDDALKHQHNTISLSLVNIHPPALARAVIIWNEASRTPPPKKKSLAIFLALSQKCHLYLYWHVCRDLVQPKPTPPLNAHDPTNPSCFIFHCSGNQIWSMSFLTWVKYWLKQAFEMYKFMSLQNGRSKAAAKQILLLVVVGGGLSLWVVMVSVCAFFSDDPS